MSYFDTSSRQSASFGQSAAYLGKLQPYHAFQYYVSIKFDREAVKVLPDKHFFKTEVHDELPPLIKSVELPAIHLDTATLNEYNRKRISQTKLNFDPVRIVIHDSTFGQALKLWQYYYKYYFRDGLKKLSPTSTGTAPIAGIGTSISNISKSLGNFGYNLTNVGNQRNLIDRIEIYQMQSGWARKITLYNPRISAFDHHSLSYESQEIVEVSYTFEYEYAEYDMAIKVAKVPELKKYFDTGRPFDIVEHGLPPAPSPFIEPDDRKRNLITGILTSIIGSNQAGAQFLDNVQNIVGTVSGYSSAYNNLKNNLPFGLGNHLPKNPIPSSRNFDVALQNSTGAYTDASRIARDAHNAVTDAGTGQ